MLCVQATLLLACAPVPGAVAAASLGGPTAHGSPGDLAASVPDDPVVLFDASTAIREGWFHREIRGATDYRTRFVDGELAVQAVGRDSASALIRWIDVDPRRCPRIEWMWRIHTLQEGADLRDREADDVAASVFLLFGEPSFPTALQEIPTLRYVWTNRKVAVESVVPNPYFPNAVRNLVVRSGTDDVDRWVVEHRDLLDDYRRAFGRDPKDSIHGIALFTDNDQTLEPVEAYYGWVRVHCSAGESGDGR